MGTSTSEWEQSFSECLDAWAASIRQIPLKVSPSEPPTTEKLEEFSKSVPKPLFDLVDKFVNNNRRFDHLINLLSYEIVSAALETGACKENSSQADQLQETLNKSDKTLLGAVIGYKLCDRYMQRCGTNQETATSSPPALHFPHEVLIRPPANTDTFHLPDLRVSKESVWTYAHSLINVKDSEVNNAIKVGKIFFDEVMTKEEVMNGSMRAQYIGEGYKRRKTEPFDPEKLNFIRDACAFVLTTNDRKKIGTAQFEAARNDPSFQTLSPDIWHGLKMPVFSKHASLQRRKFEESEDQLKITNVKSIAGDA